MAEAGQAVATRAGSEPAFASGRGRIGETLAEYLGEGALRQLGLLIGLSAAIAAGIALFMWAQQPTYRSLFSALPAEDTQAVVQALESSGIEYRLDEASGAIRVPADRLHEARLTLAGEGLPRTGGVGFESLREDSGFGTSQFMENARFHRSLETELSRTIMTLRAVRTARVHLAIPERSAFLRDRREPRGSVTVGLFSGRALSDGQALAIANMVASAVPELAVERVSVVDQRGRLLTADGEGSAGGSAAQLDYKHRVEMAYAERIRELLAPILGEDRVRAKVDARIDFARSERTEERYDPDGSVLRSEQTSEQVSDRRGLAMGIPGALTNQPPGDGTLAEEQPAEGEVDEEGAEGEQTEPVTLDRSASETRNYEVSRVINHIQGPRGEVQRLSVAVLLDEPVRVDDAGETVAEPFSDEQLAQVESLVRQAVGFDPQRGDSLDVVSAPFQLEEAAPPEPPAVWEQPWFTDMGKLLLAALLGLILILVVVRPLVNALLGRDRTSGETGTASAATASSGTQAALEDGQDEFRQLPGPAGSSSSRRRSYEDNLRDVREVAGNEPALAANVVKSWLAQGNE